MREVSIRTIRACPLSEKAGRLRKGRLDTPPWQPRSYDMEVDRCAYQMDSTSREAIREALAQGKVGGVGEDEERIVDMACWEGPEFLDEVLSKLEKLGESPDYWAHQGDVDGYCAVMRHADKPEFAAVFLKHGVNLEWRRLTPLPWSSVYQLYTERKTIAQMEETARKWHEGQVRKDGKTPYVEHPAAVAALLGKWGFCPDWHGLTIAIAWGHDLLEETPPEKRGEVEHDIRCSVCGLLHEDQEVLDAIRLLTRDRSVFPDKADYIRHVAETASQHVLAVKIADRLCNARDFLSLPGSGPEKARAYLAAGQPLFEHLGHPRFPADRIIPQIETSIRDEIESVRREIDAAENAPPGP